MLLKLTPTPSQDYFQLHDVGGYRYQVPQKEVQPDLNNHVTTVLHRSYRVLYTGPCR